MVGSGVFALPASLAPFGGIALGGWLVTSAGSIALALVFGRLARLVPATGGPYAYTRAGFGDFAGFLVAWGYWITLWSGNAAVAVALSGYLAYFLPILREQPVAGLAAALGAIWLVTLINVRGVKEAGLFQVATTVLKLVPLLLTATVGLAFVAPSHFVPLNTSGLGTFGALAACSAQTLWAFLGLESATVPAGDVDRPEVTIPRATVLGTSFAAVLYILVTVAVFGIVPLGDLAHSSAPLADAAERVFGPWAGSFVALGAVVSTIGTLNGFTMLSGQVPRAPPGSAPCPRRHARLRPDRLEPPGERLVALNFTKGMGAASHVHHPARDAGRAGALRLLRPGRAHALRPRPAPLPGRLPTRPHGGAGERRVPLRHGRHLRGGTGGRVLRLSPAPRRRPDLRLGALARARPGPRHGASADLGNPVKSRGLQVVKRVPPGVGTGAMAPTDSRQAREKRPSTQLPSRPSERPARPAGGNQGGDKHD